MFNKYTEVDPWKIIERGWDSENHPKSESLFSIGNGRMGQRANLKKPIPVRVFKAPTSLGCITRIKQE